MTKFYKKNEDGEFVEADKDVDDLFRERSGSIVSERLSSMKEKIAPQVRAEIEADVRKESTEKIRGEVKTELESEYKTRLEESEAKARDLDIRLRRKTVAAEFGFKPEVEKFLGDGSEEDMRKEADALKSSFATSPAPTFPEKETSEPKAGSGFVTLVKN